MLALATAFVAVLVSLLLSRVATVALTLTGMSRETARFQARSALSGTGFTTTEAEQVVTHPVRRKVVMLLMLVGSAGLVTVIATLMLSFTSADRSETLVRLLVLLGGLVLIVALSRSSWVDRRLSRLIGFVLRHWTGLEARDYGALLHLADRYEVSEMAVGEDHWLTGGTLGDLGLRDEGVVLLGVTLADGTWLGAPTFDTRIRPGETVVVYGPGARIAELDRRRQGPDGDRAHEEAAAEHGELVASLTDDAPGH